MKIVVMGTPDFAVTVFDAVKKAGHEIVLAVSQPDKPKGRSGQLAPTDVKKWALENDIPVFQPKKIRDAEAIAELQKYNADLFLVVAFGQILPKEVLDMPRLGCVNVHGSLLPKYRGAAPIQWAVINGDEYAGVTTMQMGVGLDDGDMLLKKSIRIESDETGGGLFDKLAILGGEAAVETIEALEKDEITPTPQNEAEATSVGKIPKSMGEIDFTKSADEIERLMRGLYPWPTAYSHLDGKVLKLFKASVITDNSVATAGTVLEADKDRFVIKCGNDSALMIHNLQLEGKKAMDTADFLRGRKIEKGTLLG